MKIAHSLLAGAALAVAMASAANAADLLRPADPIYSSPLFNFEGLYLGGSAGGAREHVSVRAGVCLLQHRRRQIGVNPEGGKEVLPRLIGLVHHSVRYAPAPDSRALWQKPSAFYPAMRNTLLQLRKG